MVGGPCESGRQTRVEVADVYEQSICSWLRGTSAEANRTHLLAACELAEVNLGAFDARILTWLAKWEPETCAVVAGLITRASSSGLARSDRWRSIARIFPGLRLSRLAGRSLDRRPPPRGD